MPSEKNIKCFELLTQMMQEEGGDGDACIKSEYYRNYADQYEKWVNFAFPNTYKRTDNDDSITFFAEPEEAIIFCDEDHSLPSWVGNMLIRPMLDLEGERTNRIRRHIPAAVSGVEATAKVFMSKDELLNIDFVKRFSEAPDFEKFSIDRSSRPLSLMAEYEHFGDKSYWCIGHIDFDVEDLPTFE